MLKVLSAFFLVSGLKEYSCRNLDLSKAEWTVTNANKSIHIPASVPGGIYSDLISAQVIPHDIFYRFNDVHVRWVAHDDWVYTTSFTESQTEYQVLVLSGVDTISSIYINGRFLGNTSNMFVEYFFDVKPYLKEQNTVTVRIYSPISEALRLSHSLSHNVPPDCTPPQFNGECHVNLLRKMQASFAWDWGPAFPSMGIWKKVSLQCYNNLSLQHVSTNVYETDQAWRVDISAFLHTSMSVRHVSMEVKMDGTLNVEERLVYTDTSMEVKKDETNTQEDVVIVKKRMFVKKNLVKLWWPNGYGDQPLYNLNVLITYKDFKLSETVTIGFRTVRLVQDPVPNNKGLTFYFLVNNVPIFAKGSNYIPAHILPEQSANLSTVNRLLYSAYLSHTNMIRVWGGGLYESDMFYALCDKYGILVWQDMMFACATYPTTGEFLQSVSTEITQQVRRLQNHPCIAIWAGNNENEVALRQNWYSTSWNESLYFEEYRELYVQTIRSIVTKEDPTREYVTSSPSNGKLSEKENFIADNPYDPLYGDTHTYNYFVNTWVPSSYPVPRFCSEYGFQSLPSHSALAQVSRPEDLTNLTTAFMTHRQHQPMGNVYLVLLIERQMDLPKKDPSMRTLIYYTQINQAWSIKTETELYRRHRSILNPDGTGLTMGALYWQLNDVWQAPSWSSIEFSGRWKMLHFYSVKFFAPFIISPTLSLPSNNLTLTLVNDNLTNVDDVVLHVYIYRWNSMAPIKHLKKFYTVKKACSEIAWILPMTAEMKGYTLDEIFIRTTVTDSAEKPVTHDNFLFPTSLRRASKLMKPANVTIKSIRQLQSDQYEIHLKSDNIALFVWLELDLPRVDETLVYFSDNGFHMIAEDHIIKCTVPGVTPQELQHSIRIQVFNDHKS
ncbi:hypothetical protein M8J76_013313 [Diaphorina citri]|nr:hypothetical protein M8J76_013313 [Diaphorina citri]